MTKEKQEDDKPKDAQAPKKPRAPTDEENEKRAKELLQRHAEVLRGLAKR